MYHKMNFVTVLLFCHLQFVVCLEGDARITQNSIGKDVVTGGSALGVNFPTGMQRMVSALELELELETSTAAPAQGDKNSIKRENVKLNMKQGLIMNQVLDVYALVDSKNVLCKNQSLEFKTAMRAFQPWALKMFDSSSKLQSGIFQGNLMEFGSFKQCIATREHTRYGEINGKQCTLKISPTLNVIKKILSFRGVSEKRFKIIRPIVEGASVYWSACVPSSCSTQDVLQHFSKVIRSIGEGLDLEITLTDIDCYSREDYPKMTTSAYVVTFCFVGLVVITCYCTITDVVNVRKNAKTSETTKIFSAFSNAKYVLSTTSGNADGLKSLNGIRYLSMAYVVVGHRYLMTLFVPSVNSLQVIEWLLDYSSTVIIGGTISVDSFFVLSGALVSYHTMEQLSKRRGSINWMLFYLHRYLRITPSFAVVVLVHATLIQYLGSGPLWSKAVAALQMPCQYFWWSALLHVQNYINPEHICILQSWYLTNDFIYYVFSPLLIYPMWKWRRIGWVYFVVVYIVSVSANFYFAWSNDYGAGMLVTARLMTEKYFTRHYIAPHIRSSTYVLGIGFGCILHRTKTTKIKMSAVVVSLGWLGASALLLASVLGNHPFQLEDHARNRLENCIFLSLHRSAWTLGVVWMVWACKHGYGGVINDILSLPAFEVLGKISYSIFLWHMSIQFLGNGALKLPLYFSNYTVIHTFFGDLCLVMMFSLLYTVLVECPFVKMSRLAFKLGQETPREK